MILPILLTIATIGQPAPAYAVAPRDTLPSSDTAIYVQVDNVPSYPGGDMAWRTYIERGIRADFQNLQNDNKSGTCTVQFVVNKDGTISNVEALTMQGTELARVATSLLARSAHWVPAEISGQTVRSQRTQKFTFNVQSGVY